MADSLKILGQIAPSANSLTDAYTVPLNTSSTVSTIMICNTGTTDETFRISVAVGGAADNIKQYLYYDLDLVAKDSFAATIGATMSAGDVVRVRATSATLSFNIFGVEIV